MLSKPEFLSVIADYLAESMNITCREAEAMSEETLRKLLHGNGWRYGNRDFCWDVTGAVDVARDWMGKNK